MINTTKKSTAGFYGGNSQQRSTGSLCGVDRGSNDTASTFKAKTTGDARRRLE